jgi:hypothetical protein
MMRIFSSLIALSLVMLGLTGPARAGLILMAADVTTRPGASGSFLVTLENTGPTAVTLSGYQIKLTTNVVGMQFTGVDRATTPSYLFPGATGAISSDFTPPFYHPPVTTFTASDFSVNTSGFDTLGAGQTDGVLLVEFAMAPSAPLGTGLVSFVSPGSGASDLTQLSDGSGNLIDFTPVNGAVSVVPEPRSLTLMLIGAVSVVWMRRKNLGFGVKGGRKLGRGERKLAE